MSKKLGWWLSGALAAAVVVGTGFRAETQGAGKPPAPPAAKKQAKPAEENDEKRIEIKAGLLTSRKVGNREITTLRKGLRIYDPEEDLEVRADEGEVIREDETTIAKLSGSIRLRKGDETTLAGDALTTDLSARKFAVSGKVHLETKRKAKPDDDGKPSGSGKGAGGQNGAPEGKGAAPEAGGNDTIILDCQSLDIDDESKTFVASGGVKIQFEDIRAQADKATFNEDESTVVLEGRVRGEQGKNIFEFAKATINTDDNTISGEDASLSLSVTSKRSKASAPASDKPAGDKKEPPPAGAPKPPTGK